MNNKVSIYRNFSDNGFIYVNVNEDVSQTKNLMLYKNDFMINQCVINNNSTLFNVNEHGRYQIKFYYMENESNIYESNIININRVDERVSPPYELNLKGDNLTFDNIDKYSMEVKFKYDDFDSNEIGQLNQLLSTSKYSLVTEHFLIPNSLSNNQYAKLTSSDEYSIESMLMLAHEIEKLDCIEYCALVPDTRNYAVPKLPTCDIAAEKIAIDAKTSHYLSLQGYLNAHNGMNIYPVWERGILGQNVNIRHVDFGLYREHEDLQGGNITVVNSRSETEDCNHGTASAGCIAASDNNLGVTGIAHKSQFYFYDTGDFDLVLNDAEAGDIISIDIQFASELYYTPVIASKYWWDRIHSLTQRGCIVLLAAGNGGLDLSINKKYMPDYGDSGGFLVGACHHNTGLRCSFSNYNHPNSIINSWGDWSVTTLGYGDLQQYSESNNRNYTSRYSGTSSATPLCCGALALIQSYAKQHFFLLNADDMKALIQQSDYNEGLAEGIGYRPNVELLIQMLEQKINAIKMN